MRTASFNRAQHIREWKRLHHTLEQQAYPIFKAALNNQTRSVVDFIRMHGTANLNAHLSVLITRQHLQDAYLSVYQKAGTRGATFAYDKINQYAKGKACTDFEHKQGPGFFSEQWRKLMTLFYNTQAAERIQGVTGTTQERVRELLAQAQDMPLSEQATYITATLDSPDFNRTRSLVIARTETTTAANYGALRGGESSDYEVAKQWLAIEDNNTRPDHRAADGQLVGVDETFTVGTSQMAYPGDVSAPASEVCNCRCSLVIVPLLGANGLPILKVA